MLLRKGKTITKRSDRIQWLFRYEAHGTEIQFLLTYHRNCSHQVTNCPITKSSGLFSPCLTSCSRTLLTWLLSFQKILFSWPLISYPQPLWHIFLHRFLFFFLSLKCWEFFKILSLAPTLLSILPSSKLIYFFTIWILITHKYVSCRHLSSLSETYIRHLTWIIHKYPKLNISKYNSSSPYSSHKIYSSFSLLHLSEFNQLPKLKP